jgi:hypothetical protein
VTRKYFPRAGMLPVPDTVYVRINIKLLAALMNLVPNKDREDHAYLLAEKIAIEAEIKNLARKTCKAVETARAKMTPEQRAAADSRAAEILKDDRGGERNHAKSSSNVSETPASVFTHKDGAPRTGREAIDEQRYNSDD